MFFGGFIGLRVTVFALMMETTKIGADDILKEVEVSEISPEEAKNALKVDESNLLKKVQKGKPLTSIERAILTERAAKAAQEMASEPEQKEYAQKQSELATILGFKDRKTIQRWIKQGGTPKKEANGYNIAAWIAYAQAKGHEVPGANKLEENVSQIAAKAQQILLQNERLEMRILKERGELIPMATAKKVFAKKVLDLKSRLFAATGRFATLAKMAPSVELAADEIRKEMTQIFSGTEAVEVPKGTG